MVRRVQKSGSTRNTNLRRSQTSLLPALDPLAKSRNDGSLFYGYRIRQCYPVTCTEYGTENSMVVQESNKPP